MIPVFDTERCDVPVVPPINTEPPIGDPRVGDPVDPLIDCESGPPIQPPTPYCPPLFISVGCQSVGEGECVPTVTGTFTRHGDTCNYTVTFDFNFESVTRLIRYLKCVRFDEENNPIELVYGQLYVLCATEGITECVDPDCVCPDAVSESSDSE